MDRELSEAFDARTRQGTQGGLEDVLASILKQRQMHLIEVLGGWGLPLVATTVPRCTRPERGTLQTSLTGPYPQEVGLSKKGEPENGMGNLFVTLTDGMEEGTPKSFHSPLGG